MRPFCYPPQAFPTLSVLELGSKPSFVSLELPEVVELCDVAEQRLPQGTRLRPHWRLQYHKNMSHHETSASSKLVDSLKWHVS